MAYSCSLAHLIVSYLNGDGNEQHVDHQARVAIVKDIIEFTPVRGKVAVMTLETV